MARTIEAGARIMPGDDGFMARALDLAGRGAWRTDPNPRVGSVVVRDGVAYIQAGAGIVADSQPEREYEETLNKAKGLLKAIAVAEKLHREGRG